MTLRIVYRLLFGLALLLGAAAAAYFLISEDLISAFRGLAYKLLAFNVAAIGVFVMELLYDWKHRLDTLAAFNRIEMSGGDLSRYYGFRILALCLLAGWIFGGL